MRYELNFHGCIDDDECTHRIIPRYLEFKTIVHINSVLYRIYSILHVCDACVPFFNNGVGVG